MTDRQKIPGPGEHCWPDIGYRPVFGWIIDPTNI